MRGSERTDQIEGCNPVLEAIRAGRPLHRVLVARGAGGGRLGPALAAARAAGVPVVQTDPAALDRMARTRNHQGIIAIAAPKACVSLADLLAAPRPGPRFLLLLDGVMDPQNLGALCRTAEAMGVNGLVLPERRAAGLTTAVERASSGALEHLPVARVTNLVRAMTELKAGGYWLIGAEAGTGRYELPELNGPVGLVLGGEGEGLRRLVREACDFLVSIPMFGRVNSLNVSAAGAILMHAVAAGLRRPRVEAPAAR
ncbi:MAG: 23S rRNA (guanosine(2251)-2'-O)-methyltransferase RlmB [Patescibacteria group bacterium]